MEAGAQAQHSRPRIAPLPGGAAHTELTGWGRVSRVLAQELRSEDLAAITRHAVLTRGCGRSYGDASLPACPGSRVASSLLADRILAFDADTGRLRAEAGLTLLDLNRTFLPRGWFPPVSPGTQFVTLGGMVASDVHGKNHHGAASFGRHLRCLAMRTAQGSILECSSTQHPDLFAATIGGMGLTGHILEVEFQLERISSAWIWQEVRRFGELDALLDGLRSASRTWPFTVAWVDFLATGRRFGRGVLLLGRWAEPGEAPERAPAPRARLRVPVDLPPAALNRASGRAYGAFHYRTHRDSAGPIHPEEFLYPLDRLRDWNRLYGRRGFTQYQCVLPHAGDGRAVERFLERAREIGALAFLCVVKDLGEEGPGLLSFPQPGFTTILDVPMHPRRTQEVVNRLNELVIAEGGRVYLAKDALTLPEHFRAMEGRLEAFEGARRKWDPDARLQSALSVRLLGDRP